VRIYKDCDVLVGSLLQVMILNWLNKAGIKHIVADVPPVGEWYAEGAVQYKKIDAEICNHIRMTIVGGPDVQPGVCREPS